MAVTKRVRFEVLRRDNYTCRYCGAKAETSPLTVDHVVPVALGGGDDPSNLVAACADCNSGKTSTVPDQPLVEDVSATALAWSQAMAKAAQERSEARASEREDADRFRALWQHWVWTDASGAEHRFDLPASYANTVRSLLAAGLTFADFEDLIEVAMKAKARDPFRYFCGCCWNRIRKDQERAAQIMQAQSEAVDPAFLERVERAFSEAWAERDAGQAVPHGADDAAMTDEEWDDYVRSTGAVPTAERMDPVELERVVRLPLDELRKYLEQIPMFDTRRFEIDERFEQLLAETREFLRRSRMRRPDDGS